MENAIFEKLKGSLCEFLRIPSENGEPVSGAPCGIAVAEALDYVTKLALSLGFERSGNIEGRVGYVELGDGEECFGVISHVDVVPPGEGWTKDPWGGIVEDGKIYGRGALDDKGPTMAALYAVYALLQEGLKPKKKIRFIFGCDEETGGNPKTYGWESIEKYIESGERIPDFGISPDADFPVINAEKGILNVSLSVPAPDYLLSASGGTALNIVPNRAEFKIKNDSKLFDADGIQVKEDEESYTLYGYGKNAHAAHADKGDNAIVKLIGYLANQKEGAMRKLSDKLSDVFGSGLGIEMQDEESGRLTQNVGRIELIDDKLWIYLNIRYPVTKTAQEVVEKIGQNWSGEVKLLRDQKPLFVPRDHFLVKSLLESYEKVTGEKSEPIAIGGGTYARAFPCFVAFGALFPGQEDSMHSPDENVELSCLYKTYEIYYDAIKKLCF